MQSGRKTHTYSLKKNKYCLAAIANTHTRHLAANLYRFLCSVSVYALVVKRRNTKKYMAKYPSS